MTTRNPTASSVSRWLGLAVLAAVAYLPALTSSPGRMPADTKLYLYLDPGGLLGRAASTFEVEQFAGWVPHQQIAYLWPSGPWYWLLDSVGLPDWVAHRLWIATVMFAAGAGVRWVSRLLGLGSGAALVAALIYQLSPFILAYVSRTSLLLLPWAALGWIVGLTIRAGVASALPSPGLGWRDRLTRWRDPAAIALVVATLGAVNATAVALIIPAPLLWLVHAAWQRSLTWRQATTAALRIGALSFVVSLWWIGMLVVQSRHGAPVLAFSETLEDVSRNSTGSEVLRTLGYWLFYQRDPIGPTTSASLPYLVSVRTMLVSYLVVLVGLAGLTIVSWPQRRYAAMLIGTGTVLAVGVHPFDSPSPLMSLLTDDDGSGLALALRSSTRAVPVLLLGVALGAGALATAFPGQPLTSAVKSVTSVTPRRLATAAIGLLAVINLPIVTDRGFVDEAIDRDEVPPTYWFDAADRIDAHAAGTRAMQLPGAEFGSFRWGHTTDQPLVGLATTPLVTRDLLPLGSAAAMDLLFALDDRVQEGTIEVEAVAPLARLFGVGTILLTNDMAFERYRTARPEIVDALLTGGDVAGLSDVERLGEPVANRPDIPMIDPTSLLDDRIGQPINPLTLIEVDEAQPVIRAKSTSIVLAGSGDGIVDAAASGLLDGSEAIRYSASLAPDELGQAIADAELVIVTDSNRDRAHHWRGSQDVHGHTEPGGPDDDVLEPTAADQRLELFDHDDASAQTVAVQDGPVRAKVSSYGEPFAYRPEDRAVMAIDGNPDTAWSVGDHGEAVGERIRLEVERPGPATVTLHQIPPAPGGRTITSIRLTVDDDRSFDVDLDPRSVAAGQELADPAFSSMHTLEIEITGVSEGDPTVAASRAGVGFTEIDLGRGATTEVIRLPVDALSAADDAPLAVVLTRLRTDPTDPWRSDPEPNLVRSFSLDTARQFDADVTLRLDRGADDSAIAALLAQPSTAATPWGDRRLTGSTTARGAAAVDNDPASAWVTPFDGALGATLTFVTTEPLQTFDMMQRAGHFSPITMVRIDNGATAVEAPVPTPDGSGRSTVTLSTPLAAGPTSLTITAVDVRPTVDRRYGDVLTLPAAIAELSSPAIPRSDNDPGATISVECAEGLLHVDGDPVRLSFSTTAASLLDGESIAAEVCDGPIRFDAGDHRVVGSNTAAAGRLAAMTVDRIVLTDATDAVIESAAPIGVVVERNDPRARTVTVAACPDGCWLVLGEGYNEAWRASAGGRDLGAPQLVDGGFNGWLLAPSEQPVTVEMQWTAQAPVTWGLTIGVVSSMLLALVIALSRRMPSPVSAPPVVRGPDRGTSRGVPAAVVLIVAATVLIAPIWGVVAVAPAAVALWAGRRPRPWPVDRALELIGLTGAIAVVISALLIERSQRPVPDAGWTLAFDHLNGLAICAVLALTVGAMFGSDAEPHPNNAD